MTVSPDNSHQPPTREYTHDVTMLIESWQAGHGESLNELFAITFESLREMARVQMNAELPGHTLQATALVSEVFLRLAGQSPDHLTDRSAFFCTVARAMKQIRIEQARRRKAAKRGGDWKRVPLQLAIGGLARECDPDERMLMLDEALDELAEVFPQHHDLTLLLYCGGLDTDQAGKVLGIARRTAQRDWKFARAFLHAKMTRLIERDAGSAAS